MATQVRKDDRIVDKVRVIVHSTGVWPNGRMSDNHWSIYLTIASAVASVRMNMTADNDDPTGRLIWSNHEYDMTNSTIMHWDYKTGPGISVKKIYEFVMNNGRDQYEMSGGGSGCRYWVYVIVSDFERHGYLSVKGAAADIWGRMLHQYSKSGPPRDLKMVKGTFTSEKLKTSAAQSLSSASTSASASAFASASTSAPKTPAGAPAQVKVRSYEKGGPLCYSWTTDGVQDFGYATEWISFTDRAGKSCVFHKVKNLISPAP